MHFIGRSDPRHDILAALTQRENRLRSPQNRALSSVGFTTRTAGSWNCAMGAMRPAALRPEGSSNHRNFAKKRHLNKNTVSAKQRLKEYQMLQLQHISTKLFIHSKFIKRRIRQQNFQKNMKHPKISFKTAHVLHF